MNKCKVCDDKTEVVFNIGFKATPICERCATAIFLQQAKWYADTITIDPIDFNKSNISRQHSPPSPPVDIMRKEGDNPSKPQK